MNTTTLSRTLAGLALLLASAACRSDPPQVQTPPAAANRTADLLARIEAERGDAACDTASQCHSIAIGNKACGGPERYMAWSSKANDGTRLRALVAEHAAARKADDAKSGMARFCCVLLLAASCICHCASLPRRA